MNSKCSLLLAVFVAVLALTSCSGSKNSCTTNCTTTGAIVNITLFDTPPAGVTFLSYSLPIVGISLTPSTGTPVSIYSPTTIVPTELTRLQVESTLIAMDVQVPAGTYTAINVTLATSGGVFINASTTVLNTNCGVGNVCSLAGGAATTVTIPMNLKLNSGQATWIGLDVNLNNAITMPTSTTLAVDFMQPNTFTATTTPRTGTPSGAFDTIGDFIGTVTALSPSSITVQNTITGQSLTATLTSGTHFDAAPSTYSHCTNGSSCIAKGSVVSMDAALTTASTLAATEIDLLDATATDEVEGVIYPTGPLTATPVVVGMILADKISTGDNTTLGAVTTTFGTGIFLAASTSINYVIDEKNLSNIITPVGFSGSGDLLAGQQIRAQVTNVASTTSGITATATNVLLRWSRFSGRINTVAGNNFSVTGIPTYMNVFNANLPLAPLVFTYSNGTLFDGVTGTGDPNFVVGKSVAIRALYLNPLTSTPPFQAAKIRVP
jgi:hypothetical protein